MLVALVILNIIDGDFSSPSVLDIVKMVLYIVCFVLLIKSEREGLLWEKEK